MKEDPLMSHEYDGIREYDNPLPGWWKGVFLASIIFAPIYAWWFHFGGPGSSPQAEFRRDWDAYAARRAEYERTAKLDVTEELLAGMASDPEVLDAGHALFTQNCVGCHEANGSGKVGPNLTDEFQIHGASRLDIYATIRDGVPDKGMLTWSQTMRDRDMAAVATYVASLRGKSLPGKAPEGRKVGRLEP